MDPTRRSHHHGLLVQSTFLSFNSALIALRASLGKGTPWRSAPVVAIWQASAISGLSGEILPFVCSASSDVSLAHPQRSIAARARTPVCQSIEYPRCKLWPEKDADIMPYEAKASATVEE